MLKIKQFNQYFSVRRADEYAKPRIIPLEKLQIPRGSILHTIDLDQLVLAPPSTLPYFQQLEKPAQVRHFFKLPENGISGHPRIKPVQGQEREIFKYHRLNRRFRRLTTDELIRSDLKVLLIENYTPMLAHYYYPDTLMAWYDRLRNVQTLMINQIKYDTAEYLRQNYMIINLGDTLPAFDKFKNTFDDRIKNKLERFHDFNLLWLLELFGWAYGLQDKSIFNGMDRTQLSRMNFIFTHNSGFTVMNMGLIEGLRKESGGRLSNEEMGRKFYRLLSHVMTSPPDTNYEKEFVTEEGDERIVYQDVKPEDEMTDGVDAAADVVDDAIVESDNVTTDDDFDTKEDLVIEAPKEDVKPTTIVVEKAINHGDIIREELTKLAEAGRVSAKAFKFLSESTERFNKIPSPYDPSKTYAEDMELTEADVAIKPEPKPVQRLVTDAGWAESTTDQIIERYNNKILKKDVMAAVASSQRLGLVVHDHRVEKEISATGNIEHHTVRVQPVDGDPVTVRFSIPSLTEDGTWVANGTEYTMRKQRVDVPIRKVSYDTVALTTAYGKNFVTRSDKVVNDYGRWLTNAIIVRAVNLTDTSISEPKLANVFDPKHTLPRTYTEIARRIAGFEANGYKWSFDINKGDFFTEKHIEAAKKAEVVPVAYKPRTNEIIGMDAGSSCYSVNGDKITPLGTISEILQIDSTKAPRELTELSIMGKTISLGFIYAYYLGLTGMLRHFKMGYEVIPAGQRVDKSQYESIIRLSDSKIVVTCDNDKQRMILHGLDKYLKYMVTYTESEMEREDVYLNLIRDADGLTARYIVELKQMRTAYVDDMHARILVKMGEPTTFIGLLERSNELLLTDQSKPEINGDEMIFLGNQRISYHVYTAFVRAMRNYNNAPQSSRRFELTQDMVWGAINSDPSVLLWPGANPIQAIKEKDVVTMGGTGGRNQRTMVLPTRVFDESDLGIMSGNTVDNGASGTITWLTNNPRFDTVDGTTVPKDTKTLHMSEAMSFIDGLLPDTLIDDGKRQNFGPIQLGSATTCVGATVTPYRTEQEKFVADRTSVKHARALKKPAKVIEVTDMYVKVRYDDKTEEAFELGRWFGAHEGSYYPHTVVTNWKAGDKLPAGAIITYNSAHFEPDIYDKYQVNWKNGILAMGALLEAEEVIEDSNMIFEPFASTMETYTSKVKDVTIASAQRILEILNEGDHVEADTILCTFTDDLGDSGEEFSSAAAATLHDLSAYAPQSGVRGVIDKIEVFYHGEIEDMSPTVADVIKKYDRIRKKKATAIGKDMPTTGSVNGDFRVEGVPLAFNNVVVRFYITHPVEMAAADKMVIANQLKTTTQEVGRGVNRTEDGTDLAYIFGRTSVDARIVGSIQRIGTSNAVALKVGEYIGRILDGEKAPALPTKID